MPPFTGLHVLPVRYRSDQLAPHDERGVDAYAAANLYAEAGLPVTVWEPYLSDGQRTDDPVVNLGRLNGAIADGVAAGRNAGRAILMTGGNCTHITGIVGGLQDAHGPNVRIGLIWFDAHGDFNTPTTTLSGSLGGMPVAVCAGLCHPAWREGSHIVAPLPTDRILMVDVRNLDPAEKRLVDAVGIPVVPIVPGDVASPLGQAVGELAARCDLLYLHVDADILDDSLVPDHGTKEPNGPNLPQVTQAIQTVMATGKVAAFAVVSVYAGGPNREQNLASGMGLIRAGLRAWE